MGSLGAMPSDESLQDPDPEGLIREAYSVHGIAASDCRSIFLDWALAIPDGMEPCIALRLLLDRHGPAAPDHPMTAVLRDCAEAAPAPRRRRRTASSTAA